MTNEGKLISRVFLDATAVDMQDDMSVWASAGDFTHWAMTVAYLLPGEFPEDLYNLNKVSFYAAQVDNGGHKQFAQNSGWQPDIVERVTAGLDQIGATEFSAVYAEFRRLMDSNLHVHDTVLNQKFGRPPKAVDDFDSRFYKLGGMMRIVAHGAAWLRSLPNLALLPSEDLAIERAAVMARNTALEKRRAERIAARNAAEAADPVYVAARRLCALVGLTFSRLTTGSYLDQPDTTRWGVMTTDGIRFMVIGPTQAQLQLSDEGKVLATVPVGI